MKDQVLRRMDDLACEASLRELIEQLPDDVGVVVKSGRAVWLPLAAADGCVAGIYMNSGHLWLLLTPTQARQVHDATAVGCPARTRLPGTSTSLLRKPLTQARAPCTPPRSGCGTQESATRVGPETRRTASCPTSADLDGNVLPEDWHSSRPAASARHTVRTAADCQVVDVHHHGGASVRCLLTDVHGRRS
jgi:hypothetical protein